jgi:hypothetical protein
MTTYIDILLEQKEEHKTFNSIPGQIRDFLITRLPKEMLCSSTLKTEYGKICTYRLAKHLALKHEHIQPNHGNLTNFIVIDDDGLDPENHLELPVPPPNLIVINPMSGHSQKWYFLEEGVTQTYFGRKKIKEYLETTIFKLKAVYNGDNGYTGWLARNPFSKKHSVLCPRIKPYTLKELNDGIGVSSSDYDRQNKYKSDAYTLINEYSRRNKKLAEAAGYGRNCAIFEILRHQAYRECHEYSSETAFSIHLKAEAGKINRNHYANNLLPENELKDIANSIARYCFSRRIKTTGNIKSFSERQKARGSLGGKARSEQYDDARAKFNALYTKNPALKTRELAGLCGVSERTIRTYKKQIEPTVKLIKPSFEEVDIYQRSNRHLAKILGVSIRTVQRRRSKSRIMSAQAINRALLVKVKSVGGDKAESGLFRCIHEVGALDKNLYILFTSCLIQIPFLIPLLL